MPESPLFRVSARFVATLVLWCARARERRHLEDLDDHVLRDIGVTRAEAMSEAMRPPWCGSARHPERAINGRAGGPVGLRAFRAR